jgi:hypothetical protein
MKKTNAIRKGALLTKGFVITDHTGVSMRFFTSSKEATIKAVCDYHRLPWSELKQICRCVEVEIREKVDVAISAPGGGQG